MYCSNCGKQIVDDSRFCPECGFQTAAVAPPPLQVHDARIGTRDQERGTNLVYPRNPPLSPHLCWVNLLVSGLAQILYGQVGKGIILLSVTIASNLVLPCFLALCIGTVSIIDAYMVGKTLRDGTPVGKWAWFPKT